MANNGVCFIDHNARKKCAKALRLNKNKPNQFILKHTYAAQAQQYDKKVGASLEDYIAEHYATSFRLSHTPPTYAQGQPPFQ